ncbi:MAG: 6-phosphofructokinase [Oscillospiraceae bacterium]|nr:6-phosphofructokinase [Oscillospiraceae bacterium]
MGGKLTGACVFAQSGGPTSVINASAYGVISAALRSEAITAVYGAAHGILGILGDTLYDLGREDPRELELLQYTPSSELGSSRVKLKDEEQYARILETFKKHNVRYFFYNGGNDSMDTCDKVSRFLEREGYECRVIGVPKTIDNDLVGTDHCPGYGSAAKYIATSIAEVYKDTHAYNTGAVTVVEIMGRNAGWLAGAAALASLSGCPPDLLYLPEIPFELDAFTDRVKRVCGEKNKCLIAVSEGIRYPDGSFVSDAPVSAADGFGHAQLGGLAAILADAVKRATGVKVRAIELSLLQRCGAHIASQTDIEEARLAGAAAVESAISGMSGKMIAFERENSGGGYACRIVHQPLAMTANAEKKVPLDWIDPERCSVRSEFYDYALPLIQGEPSRPLENGLPRFARLKKIRV